MPRKSSPSKQRGRPAGSTNYPGDEELLKNVALLLYREKCGTPTEAFRTVADGDIASQRRVQRKWDQSGRRYLKRAQAIHWDALEHQYRALRNEHPQLWYQIEYFRNSETGRTALSETPDLLGDPAHPMSLGLMRLYELIKETVPLEVSQIDEATAANAADVAEVAELTLKLEEIHRTLSHREVSGEPHCLENLALQLETVAGGLDRILRSKSKP